MNRLKALEILKNINVYGYATEVEKQIDEAIAELEELENIKNTVIEEIEYAIAKPECKNVYLNNALRFLRNK